MEHKIKKATHTRAKTQNTKIDDVINKNRLHLNSVLSDWKVHFLLLLPFCLQRCLSQKQATIHSASTHQMFITQYQLFASTKHNTVVDRDCEIWTKTWLNYLMLGESPPDSSSLLGTKIKWQKLLVLVRLSQCRLLLLWDHCQHLSDWFPHHLAEIQKKKTQPIWDICLLNHYH